MFAYMAESRKTWNMLTRIPWLSHLPWEFKGIRIGIILPSSVENKPYNNIYLSFGDDSPNQTIVEIYNDVVVSS